MKKISIVVVVILSILVIGIFCGSDKISYASKDMALRTAFPIYGCYTSLLILSNSIYYKKSSMFQDGQSSGSGAGGSY